MEHYVGVDVSLEYSSMCVVSREGKIVAEGKALSEPEALAMWMTDLGLKVERVGLEAGPLSQWLTAGLEVAGFEVALLETRHVRAALSAMVVKTDRNDARGIAQLLRMGWFRPVHCKSVSAQEVRAMLTARKQLMGKMVDVETSTRGILRGFGLKVGQISRGRFLQRIHDLIDGHSLLQQVIEPMLSAREALRSEVNRLHCRLKAIAKTDPVCTRLMTTPGVGVLVGLTYMSGVDDPLRFSSSRSVGPYLGLTPRRYQSGETDIVGKISCAGDAMARSALYEAATVILTRAVPFSPLKKWAVELAGRRGVKRARVALARKLAVILHRIWVDETTFTWSRTELTPGVHT